MKQLWKRSITTNLAPANAPCFYFFRERILPAVHFRSKADTGVGIKKAVTLAGNSFYFLGLIRALAHQHINQSAH